MSYPRRAMFKQALHPLVDTYRVPWKWYQSFWWFVHRTLCLVKHSRRRTYTYLAVRYTKHGLHGNHFVVGYTCWRCGRTKKFKNWSWANHWPPQR